jgi:peptidylprolyl isomerase
MRISRLGIASTLVALACATCSKSSDSGGAQRDAAQPAAATVPAGPIDRGDGLTVEVLSAGKGPEVGVSSEVSLSYRAFVDGRDEPFDSSDDSGVPFRLVLGANAHPRVIEGLSRGLVGLRAGTKAKLHIPPELGWGSTGNPQAGVPADSKLTYEVHLLDVR